MRYIDADALIKKIYPMGIGDGKYTINAKAVKLAIDNTPTADVVPKSEVDRQKEINEQLFKEMSDRMFEERRIERNFVVRKVFREIEKETEEALKSNYKARYAFEPSDGLYQWVQGKIDALRGIENFIAELKKKYTEVEK